MVILERYQPKVPKTNPGETCVLFWDNDNRGVEVHLNVERLVLLQSVFQPRPSLLPEAFQSLTGDILEQVISQG